MYYQSLERRNKHFRRQSEIEKKLAEFSVGRGELRSEPDQPLERNSKLWAISIVLVFPAFIILYFLSTDLILHEKSQQTSLKRVLPDLEYRPQRIPVRTYVILTLATLGFGGIYWLYRVVNIYNNHFREHRIIDDEINRFIEASSHGESV
jgi:hypothetical protein